MFILTTYQLAIQDCEHETKILNFFNKRNAITAAEDAAYCVDVRAVQLLDCVTGEMIFSRGDDFVARPELGDDPDEEELLDEDEDFGLVEIDREKAEEVLLEFLSRFAN